ncbi:hypothetical protein ANN_06534 [Periplaneta americana]|uniref:Mos1 transposase HTH domain-containing protein n=1 Tax=Periplaneta americana TaxID=6978 RepID=A0ABQ8TG61_PERAM|nr:hypothetical protein ANN_06534 [Periplaneta americana]
MFTKQEQQSLLKIQCTYGHTARQCHEDLVEAYGEMVLPYRTVARWIRALNEGHEAWQTWLGSVALVSVTNNALVHVAHLVADLYRHWGWEVLFHPPYSPDLSPCDYDLIPKMKELLCDIRFRTVPKILQAVGHSIRNINRTRAATRILQFPHNWQ